MGEGEQPDETRGQSSVPQNRSVTYSSREHILNEIRRLAAEQGGMPLGKVRFEVASGIRESEWMGRYWARWNDAVLDAGFEPNTWQGKTLDDEALIGVLADVVRGMGRFPTTPDLRLWRKSHPQVPNDKVFSARFGTKADQLARVLVFAKQHPEYADVAAICASAAPISPRPKALPVDAAVVTGVVYLIAMGEFHKIGKTNDVGRRIYEIGLRLPERHDVVHVIETDDPSGIESYWHRRFASQRANGEWFRLAPSDVAAFKRRTFM